MQSRIETVIEEVTQEKFEKIAEVKAEYEFLIKGLDKNKEKQNKEKLEKKKQERDQEIKSV